MTDGSATASTTFTTRFFDWARRSGLSRKLAISLAVAAVGSGAATYGVITDSGVAPNPRTVLFLLVLDLILLLLLGAVVAWRIVRLWAERRRGMAGSKLHVELVVLFSALAVAPTVVMAVFSTLFFNLGVETWFSERVKVALKESLAVAQAYLTEHGDMIRGDILAMSSDLNREEPELILNRRLFQQRVTQQAYLRTLQEAVVFDEQGQTIASVNFTATPQTGLVPFWALNRAHDGELVLFDPDSVEGTVGGSTDRVRALIKLDAFENLFLMVGRVVDPRVIGHLERTIQATQAYENIEGQRSGLEITFAMIFGLVALLLLLSAIWVGLVLANRLARPIAELVGAAERVRSGDLAARVDERERQSGEIGSLSRAFNRMASQLENQRRELVEANRQLDHRRRFTEAVLTGVSSGVIGLDADGRINLPNRSASDLLATDLDRLVGDDFGTVVPEMLPLLEAARGASGRPAEGQITALREGRRRSFFVRIAGQPLEDGTRGYVVTFDDVTELEAAQRKAAWSDVARRIAHEIKNPLTPIQLSAERLRRKYMGEIKTDPETFRMCTETIVRQVGDIGRMVDEFSSFARMPAPSMREDDLAELVRQTVFLQRNARPEIAFESEIPHAHMFLSYDPRQIGQALTNLLQNAIDAIDGREAPDGGTLPPGRVGIRIVERDGRTAVAIEDNGKGLPAENRERLTEPYVTTRAKGTGLGLAIVKKIMEDHGGDLVLEDRAGGGTSVSLVFAALARSDDALGTDAAAPVTKAAVHGA